MYKTMQNTGNRSNHQSVCTISVRSSTCCQ